MAIVSGRGSEPHYAQRTPLQMSHEASSIRDLIRPGEASSWSSWTAWAGIRETFSNLVHELEEKGQASGCWSLPSIPVGQWAAWS
jgi:hypothetical protein